MKSAKKKRTKRSSTIRVLGPRELRPAQICHDMTVSVSHEFFRTLPESSVSVEDYEKKRVQLAVFIGPDSRGLAEMFAAQLQRLLIGADAEFRKLALVKQK